MMHRDTPQTSLPTHVTDSRGSKLLLQLIRNPARVPLKVGGPEGGGWVPPPPPPPAGAEFFFGLNQLAPEKNFDRPKARRKIWPNH